LEHNSTAENMLVTHQLMLNCVHFSLNPLINTYLNASNDSKVRINTNNTFFHCRIMFSIKSMPYIKECWYYSIFTFRV